MSGSDQNTEKVFVYDAFGRLSAEYSTGMPAPPCTTCYIATDHLGSTRLVTDQSGNTVGRHDFLPVGEEIAANSGGRDGTFGTSDFVNQKFTGQEHDSETGLDFFQARYFSGALGRFNSPDPGNAGANLFSPQSWNGYSYVGNNPLTLIDPIGMDTCPAGLENNCVDVNGGPPDPVQTDPCFFFDCVAGGFGYYDIPQQHAPPPPPPPPPNAPRILAKAGTCNALANGQTPDQGFLSWYMGVGNAMQVTSQWALGIGPTQTDFGPDSFASKQMMSAYGLPGNVKAFLGGGQSSGHQDFGLSGLWTTGLNPTAQFVGSYDWSVS